MNADGDAFRQRIEEIADDDLDPDARFRFNLDMNLPRTAEALRL